MKLYIFPVVLALLLSGAALAADKPPLDLPVYAGGEKVMEINLTNDDLLPMIKATLPMLAGKDSLLQSVDPDDIVAIFKDVKRVEMIQVDLSKAGTSPKDVAAYYANHLPAGQWNQVFTQMIPGSGTVAVYAQNQGERLYGYRVRSVMVDGKSICRVEVAKTDGKLDFARLVMIASKVIGPRHD